jgi:RNA polymerase sigma-70 factor, ECF subfamily
MEVKHMDDIDRVIESDKEVLVVELMEKHGTELVNLAYTYVQDWGIAEEVIQDVFFKCYQNLDAFRGDASLKTWLYRIAINRCRDEMRKASFRKLMAHPLSNFFSLKSNSSSPEEQLVARTEKEVIADHVLSLPSKYREVIILYYYSNLKTEEIAQLIQQNAKTIRTRLRRARQFLQERLGEVDTNE